ncbi:MAG TPA: hypothetical protein VK771_09195 [Acidimicrobiia bacterium]|nr:hypothetical protein [Acidimicrobiia bacterium]
MDAADTRTGPPRSERRTYALVSDLMDRSRISATLPATEFVRDVAACTGADVVLVDLARFGADVAALRAALPSARLVCFGPHVDDVAANAARAAGADAVLARSRFFRDPLAAIDPSAAPDH